MSHETSGFHLHVTSSAAVLLAVAIACFAAAAPPAQAQVFTTIHTFTGGADGYEPDVGFNMDHAGNLYGTAVYGGHKTCFGPGCGTVYKLERKGSSWVVVPLYEFNGPDGEYPETRVIFGPDGNLYGTTQRGGDFDNGVVFRLQPLPAACKAVLCPWTETVIHSFAGGSDGEQPTYGDLLFDQAGNIYGTTPAGGNGSGCQGGCGVVYELSPSNGGWTEKILYNFQGGSDGASPYAGVVLDNAGNLYGTAAFAGIGAGVVYELTPSEGSWTQHIIYTFTDESDGGEPYGGLIFDASGNLYGATVFGTVYELTPNGGGWTFNLLYTFQNVYEGSFAAMTFDSAGNLIGTLAIADVEVFRLTPSNGQWILTGFSGSVGSVPTGNVILDAAGNLYTTTSEFGAGYAFEISP
jgi:uncharacterized repeat protein (TIGR03803 family)